MIDFHYEADFKLKSEAKYADWIKKIVSSENKQIGQLDYIFCSDEYLLEKNKKFLNHDTYTDIITFDYSEGMHLGGDIFISIDRLEDNANKYNVRFENELLRVMSHGVLHLLGFKDKTDDESKVMRRKEKEKIKLFHVEH